MAQKSMDNGTSDARTPQRPIPGESPTARTADMAPPGSRERAEGHTTGWTPEREAEDAQLRQGPFHRAAQERLYQPRDTPDTARVGSYSGRVPRRGPPRPLEEGEETWARFHGGPLDRPYRTYPSPGMRAREDERLRWDDTSRTWREEEPGYPRDDAARLERIRRGGEARADTNFRDTALDERWDVMDRFDEQRLEEARRYDVSQGRGGMRPSPRGLRGEDWRRDEERARFEERGRYDVALGLDGASPGIPGRGLLPGGRPVSRTEARGLDTRGLETDTTGRRWQREPLTARELMTRTIKTVRRDSPLREVAQVMKDEDCGVVPIVDEQGRLLGLVTDRDLVVRAFTGAKTPDTVRVSDVMTLDVQAVTPDEDVHSIIALMGRRQVRRVPVVDRDDRLLGLISLGDIANRADYDEELQEALDRISARRSFWNRLG